MALVRRSIAILLVFVVSLWLPLRAAVDGREALLPNETGSFSAQPPAESPVLTAAVQPAAGSNWQGRQAHDLCAASGWVPGAGAVLLFRLSLVPDPARAIPPPFRAYPLLI